MSNSWLCTRSKLFQICQIRSLTNSSWFQNRSNAISLDLGSNAVNFQGDGNLSCASVTSIKAEHSFFDWNGRNCLLHTTDGSSDKPSAFNRCDIFTFLGARNQDLIRSLAKIVEPLECNDTIHVDSSSKNYVQPVKACKKANIHAFNSFDAFSTNDDLLKKDFCVHMSAPNTAVKKQEKNWQVNRSGTSGGKKPNKDDDRKGPSIDQLEAVKDYYQKIVPGFHKRGEQFSAGLHHKDMVFENNFFKKPKITVGASKYSMQLTKMRMMATFLYPSYYLEIQSINSNLSDGYVRMHWRMYYMSNFGFVKRLFPLLKGMWQGDGGKAAHDTIDGISTFHVNRDGKIVLHKLDRKIPIQNSEVSPVKNLAAKTVEMVGLAPKSSCKNTSKEIL